jgi:hypothetical protein
MTKDNNELSTGLDIPTTQKEKITSPSSTSMPSQDQMSAESMATTDASSSSRTTSTSKETPYQYQYQQNYQQQQREEQQSGINRALDETKDSIRKSVNEARRDIPRYTQAVNDYHEQAIESARQIADNFLESQKEIINSLQSAWLPQIDAANRVFTSNWISPRHFTQIYANIINSFANNWIAATRLANNMVFSNMEAFRTTMQQTRDNAKELSRIAVNTARSSEQTSRDIARSTGQDISTASYASGYTQSKDEKKDVFRKNKQNSCMDNLSSASSESSYLFHHLAAFFKQSFLFMIMAIVS